MFFRNLTLFRFPTTTKLDALDAGLAECLLEPVGPLNCPIAASSRLSGGGSDAMSRRIGDASG
jgi:recombination associated protein RdgC